MFSLSDRLQHSAGIDIGKRIDLLIDLRTWFSVQFNGHNRLAAFFLSGKTEIADVDAFFCHDFCNSGNGAGSMGSATARSCVGRGACEMSLRERSWLHRQWFHCKSSRKLPAVRLLRKSRFKKTASPSACTE